MRVLLCGTNYGSTYVRSLQGNENGLALAGIVARSERSRALAQQVGVPFHTSVDDVPRDAIDAAIVAISCEAGFAITGTLLSRDVPVLAEHPVSSEEVRAHRRHRVPYHVNAHYSDIDAAATFIGAAQAAGARSRLLFVNVLTNPRALFSAIEICARGFGVPHDVVHAEGNGFFSIAHAGPITFHVQRETSEVDDGSSMWVSHHITAGFEEGTLTLGEAYGPVMWMPSPPSIAQLQAPGGAELWTRPLWRLLASPPPAFGDYAGWARDRANRVALGRFAHAIATGTTPAEQSEEHLLGVSRLWEQLIG